MLEDFTQSDQSSLETSDNLSENPKRVTKPKKRTKTKTTSVATLKKVDKSEFKTRSQKGVIKPLKSNIGKKDHLLKDTQKNKSSPKVTGQNNKPSTKLTSQKKGGVLSKKNIIPEGINKKGQVSKPIKKVPKTTSRLNFTKTILELLYQLNSDD